MGIGKQIEKVSIIKLMVPLQLKELQGYWAVCKAEYFYAVAINVYFWRRAKESNLS